MTANQLRRLARYLPLDRQPYEEYGGDLGAWPDNWGYNASTLHSWIGGRSPELQDAAEEVAAEQTACILLTGRSHDALLQVLAHWRQIPTANREALLEQDGIWRLAVLPPQMVGAPAEREADSTNPSSEASSTDTSDTSVAAVIADLGQTPVDLVIYVLPAATPIDPDLQWIACLRTLGVPLLPVVVIEGVADALGSVSLDQASVAMMEVVRSRLGMRPELLCPGSIDEPPHWETQMPPEDVRNLTSRLLRLRPRLGIPLALEAPWCRRFIAQRVIRSGAMLAALVASEPLPLLDLPLLVAIQWKVALQLATIYGRPGLDYRSTEMAGTVSLGLAVRMGVQQLAKVVPLGGWLLSAGLSGFATMVFGYGLLTHYEEKSVHFHRSPLRVFASQLRHSGPKRAAIHVRNARRVLSGWIETW